MRRHVLIDRHKAAKPSNSHLHNNQPADLTQEDLVGFRRSPVQESWCIEQRQSEACHWDR